MSKIINDPVHGFITISDSLILDIINSPEFQRLRRIKQLGLTSLTFPGAVHTRFQHAIGAMHLANASLQTLKNKNVALTSEEHLATRIAVLLHDIGHGPFSHALEGVISNIHHEHISKLFMQSLIKKYGDIIQLSISIFENKYPKTFLHQLVSSQLDVDRIDYLSRDSFYTGVSEGVIGSERIISMFNVHNNQLAVEEKGVLSIEKFLLARRIMYWQVYLHKTVASAEYALIKAIERLRFLLQNNLPVDCPHSLKTLLLNQITITNHNFLSMFNQLDDFDVFQTLKLGQNNSDKIFSTLSRMIIQRHLYKVEIANTPFSKDLIDNKKKSIANILKINIADAHYFCFEEKISNNAYETHHNIIKILKKNHHLCSILDLARILDSSSMTSVEEKWFFMSFSEY